MMNILTNMTEQSIKCIKEYRNDLDVLDGQPNPQIDGYTRAFCLSILFYLGQFESIVDGKSESYIDHRGANILAVTQ